MWSITILVLASLLAAVPTMGKPSAINCPALPPHTPANITDLRPNDIDVIMVLGDSISAGFGIMGDSTIYLLDEWRGKVFSIGGDEGETTVGNFLKYYNPNLYGTSSGSHFVEVCIDPHCSSNYHPAQDGLNAAQSGAQIDDLLDKEIDYILTQLNGSNVDIQNSWKMMTIFIGANDLCSDCDSTTPYALPDIYEKNLVQILEKVRTNLPRTFVSLVGIFNLSGVYEAALSHTYCKNIHRVFSFECDCILRANNTVGRQVVDEVGQQVNQRLFAVAQSYANKYDDFAVVVQPFAMNTNIADLPIDFLSTLDCFHPSLLAHQTMAVALWNNLLTPSAQKQTVIDVNAQMICPDADTLLYTY